MSDKTDEWDFSHPARAQPSDDSLIEAMARAAYARNGWWRIVSDDDDGKGRYRDNGEFRMRAVEWEQLTGDERRENLQNMRAALVAQRTFKREQAT